MLSRIRSFLSHDRRGVAAVEFAILLPLMLSIYVAAVDLTRGVMATRKLDLLSRTVSDLVSQQPTTSAVTSATLETIFTAATAVMSPLPASSVTITVSAVTIKPKSTGLCCDVMVNWSYTKGGTLRPCSVALTQVGPGVLAAATNFPQYIITANQLAGHAYTTTATTTVIIADAKYTYSPIFFQARSWFSAAMQKTMFMVPRAATGTITLSSPINAASGSSGAICS